MLFDIVIY